MRPRRKSCILGVQGTLMALRSPSCIVRFCFSGCATLVTPRPFNGVRCSFAGSLNCCGSSSLKSWSCLTSRKRRRSSRFVFACSYKTHRRLTPSSHHGEAGAINPGRYGLHPLDSCIDSESPGAITPVQEAEQAAAEAQRWKRAAETAEAEAAQTEARCAKKLSTLDSEHMLEVDMLRKQVERLERELTAITPGAQQVLNLQTEVSSLSFTRLHFAYRTALRL
jgi:hypothetical protein